MSDQDQSPADPADPAASAVSAQVSAPTVPEAAVLDLDAIERDLADVEVALSRLDAGTYWVDEVTGEPLTEQHLAEHPTARRA